MKKKTNAQPPKKKHVFSEVGFVKGIGVLKNLNQTYGLDCPGCAWPDPDEKRAFLAEYCEKL